MYIIYYYCYYFCRELILNKQVPTWGLIVLLVSKAGGVSREFSQVDCDAKAGENEEIPYFMSELLYVLFVNLQEFSTVKEFLQKLLKWLEPVT